MIIRKIDLSTTLLITPYFLCRCSAAIGTQSMKSNLEMTDYWHQMRSAGLFSFSNTFSQIRVGQVFQLETE